MEVVLTQDIPNLGQKGEVKSVKKGYFRNFLAPRSKAIRVTPKLMKKILDHEKGRVKRKADMLEKAEELVTVIAKMTITFTKKTTAKGKLYASINEKKVQQELEKELKFDLEKGAVKLTDTIKELGEYEGTVSLTENIKTNVKILVVEEEEI
jgi:large subunit ribosomal protein L9